MLFKSLKSKVMSWLFYIFDLLLSPWIRIRIPNPDPDPEDPLNSDPDPDPNHCFSGKGGVLFYMWLRTTLPHPLLIVGDGLKRKTALHHQLVELTTATAPQGTDHLTRGGGLFWTIGLQKVFFIICLFICYRIHICSKLKKLAGNF